MGYQLNFQRCIGFIVGLLVFQNLRRSQKAAPSAGAIFRRLTRVSQNFTLATNPLQGIVVGSWTSHPTKMLVKHSASGIRGKICQGLSYHLLGVILEVKKIPQQKKSEGLAAAFRHWDCCCWLSFFSVGVFVFFVLASHPRFQGLNCAFAIC